MPIKHLLKQIETYSAKRNNRDVRPDWLTDLIDQVADLFEPLSGVGRVGFDCQPSDEGWAVGLFLGRVEIVGGKHDGRTRQANFQFNLAELAARFDRLVEFYWSAFPDPDDSPHADARSFVTIAGCIGDEFVRLQIFAVPPEDAGPGLRQLLDGSNEPV